MKRVTVKPGIVAFGVRFERGQVTILFGWFGFRLGR